MLDPAVEADRELLLAVLRRHGDGLSTEVLCGLAAAADELVDPLVLPTLVEVEDSASADVAVAVRGVRGRLQRAAATVTPGGVGEAMACARAARALVEAERVLAGGGR